MADLRDKLAVAERDKTEIENRHKAELAEILTRHSKELSPVEARYNLTKTTLEGFISLYPQIEIDQEDAGQKGTGESGGDTTPEPDANKTNTSPSKDQKSEVPPRVDPKDQNTKFKLRHEIVSLLKEANEFLTSQEVYVTLKAKFPSEIQDKQKVLVGLRDTRRARVIAGVPVVNPLGGFTYLHGLRDFLANPDDPDTVKGEYFDKLFEKVTNLGYSFTKPDHKEDADKGSSEKKLAPAPTGASGEADTDVGGNLSVDAVGKPEDPHKVDDGNPTSVKSDSLMLW